MPNPTEATTSAELALCSCVSCGKRNGTQAAPIGTLHAYSSTPRGGWSPRRTADLSDATAATYGVELETAAPSRTVDLAGAPDVPWSAGPDSPERTAHNVWAQRNRAHLDRQRAARLTVDEACAVAAPRGMWHAKHDGSVSGPEYASQPATLAYWHAQRPALAGMFRALIHGGFRSWDSETCGAHVNIGTDTFGGDADHIRRFADLLYANPRWTTRMSGRTHGQVSHWCRFDPLGTPERREEWARSLARYGSASQDRYSVLNGHNAGRIECRIPRGTLNLSTFYAHIEWMAASVEYTRDASNRPNPSAFTAWVEARRSEYPDLYARLADRFPGRVERAAA